MRPKNVLSFFIITRFFLNYRMGSFTSMPKIRPAPNSEDNDVDYGNGENIGLDDFLNKCRLEMGASMPNVIPRKFRHRRNSLSHEGKHFISYNEINSLIISSCEVNSHLFHTNSFLFDGVKYTTL